MASNPTGIPALVGLAVLGAAALHAVWNALAKSVDDELVGFAVLEALDHLAADGNGRPARASALPRRA